PGVQSGARCARPVELLDLYRTLADLCGLPDPPNVEGRSLRPLLQAPDAPWPWPAITTHGPNNHAVRTERWRYIRYADGSEELYDMTADPNEWTNLASLPEYRPVKRRLARWLPRVNTPPVPGSVIRLIELREDGPWWEGKPIGPDDPIPD
ncbi:MAG: DUF4976 domain-containing protein, partial [Verrucomicrobia bacterium]